MKKQKSIYPKSSEADICMVLEGTYPFSRGGVSNWVYELIRVFPQYRFAVIFLGTKKKDYHGFVYPIPENIVHLEAYYLYDKQRSPVYAAKRIKQKTMRKIVSMHDKFKHCVDSPEIEIPEVFDLMHDTREINKKQFLRSRTAWDYIEKQYNENYSEQSFFDYFWGVRSLHQPFWLLKKIVDRMPMVKVIHSASTGYAGFLAALIQKRANVPYVLTEHGIYTNERWIELIRNFFFQKTEQKDKLLGNNLDLSNLWINFFRILAKVGYDRADPIISLFEGYRQYQIKDGAKPDRTRIISYGIDFERFPFLNKKPPNNDTPTISFIGRIVPIKDVKTFIRAVALVLQQKPHAEVLLAGPTNEDPDYVESCKNLATYLGVSDKLKFLGFCNVHEIYQKTDLVIMTSISEGSPFTILESFAVGVPIVTTDVGGCKELIFGKNAEDQALGEAGKLVSIADPDGIAEAALQLLNNEAEWAASQKVGLERVRKYYSMEQLIENYSKIYQEAMTDGRHRV